jgi:pimeloyl-ACP methyl ester carboxylesterase
MGSFNVRLFAYRYPKQVAGRVLVDPSADNQMAVLAAAAPSTMKMQQAQSAGTRACAAPDATPEILKRCGSQPPFDLPPKLMGKGIGLPGRASFATALAEFDAFNDLDSNETVGARRSLGSIPLIVLTAADTSKNLGAPPEEVEAPANVWSHLHDDIAAFSTRGVNRLFEGTGHDIQAKSSGW